MGMQFSPTVDLGSIVAIIVFAVGLYTSGRRWVARVDERLVGIEGRQSEAATTVAQVVHQVERLDQRMEEQRVSMARMETSVVDPLRRFAGLEGEYANQSRNVVRLETHVTDLERRVDEQATEIRGLRERLHALANSRGTEAIAAEVARAKLGANPGVTT